jgi:hypothetical protein
MDMKVYAVEHKTWHNYSIVKVFADEKKAMEHAEKMERQKSHSDGYMEYYVKEFEVEV